MKIRQENQNLFKIGQNYGAFYLKTAVNFTLPATLNRERSLRVKWYQSVREGEGVEILRKRATVFGSTRFNSLVYLEGGYESDV